MIDGVFALEATEGGPAEGGPAEGDPAGTLRFHPADPLDEAAVHRLEELLRRRILRHFQRQGLLEADDVETMLGWQHGGFSLDASARVEAWDRDGLERLLRYCGRPLLAGERLAWAGADGEKVAYTLAHPDPDGRTVLILTPLEFLLELLRRLAHLVPPPRRHLLRYWGVLAPNSPLRAHVIALATAASGNATADVSTAEAEPSGEPGGEPITGTAADPEPQGEKGKGRRASPQASLWALLLTGPGRRPGLPARILALLPLTCPVCGQQMQIIAFVTDSDRGRARPGCVQLEPPHPDPSRRACPEPPPLSPARDPPEQRADPWDFDPGADPTPDFDPNVDPEPQFDTDQSVAW